MAAPSTAEGLETVGVLHMDTDLHLPAARDHTIPEAGIEVSLPSLRTQIRNEGAETFLPWPKPAPFSQPSGLRRGPAESSLTFICEVSAVAVCVCLSVCECPQLCLWAKGR